MSFSLDLGPCSAISVLDHHSLNERALPRWHACRECLSHLDLSRLGLYQNYFGSWYSGSWDYCVHLKNASNIRVKATKQCNQASKVTTSLVSLTATSYRVSAVFQALYLHSSNVHSNLPGRVTISPFYR